MFFKKRNSIHKVKELKDELSRLRHAIRTDELTGVLNRRGIMEEFGSLFREALYSSKADSPRRKLFFNDLCILFFDIDNFKSVNDTFGHEAGDMVLIEFAQCLAKNIRGLDKVGRLGGEEFCVLLLGADEKEGYQKAVKLGEKIRNLKFGEGAPKKITASIGVASLAQNRAQSIEALIKIADEAMYEAKANRGKDTAVKASELK